MAGESVVSEGDIERRAEELEAKNADEKKKADDATAAEAAAKAAEDKGTQPENKDDQEPKKGPDGKFLKREPNDPVELRRWATRTSMELAELKKEQQRLQDIINRGGKKPLDLKVLVKDEKALEKAISDREKELVEEHQSKFNEEKNEMIADITRYEDQSRSRDKENYPQWVELKPIMQALSEPNQTQPHGDPRINFNRHPKVVLDDLYVLAQKIAANDPSFKKVVEKPAAANGKTYSQEELDAKIKEAADKAASEAAANLRNEAKGGSVTGMTKGAGKGKPGEIDKDVAWNMPLNDLKSSIQKATDNLRG